MCWSRRRRSSTRSPPAWRARCPTAPPPARAVTSGAQAGFDLDIGVAARRQHDQRHLHRTRPTRSARITIVRVDDPGALPLSQRDRRSERQGHRASISRAAWPRSSRSSAARSAATGRYSSPIRPARRCACSMTASRAHVDINAASTTTHDDVAHRRQRASCRSSSMAAQPYIGAITGSGPAERRLCRPHHGQSGAARRPVAARRLQHVAADLGRRRRRGRISCSTG